MKGLAAKTDDLSLIPAADLQLVLACTAYVYVSTHTYKHTHTCMRAHIHVHTNIIFFIFKAGELVHKAHYQTNR